MRTMVKKHRKKFLSFTSIGAGTFLLGNLLLFMFVSMGMFEWLAFIVQQLVCTSLGFVLNLRITWRSREVSLCWSIAEFIRSKVLRWLAKWVLFFTLTTLLPVHYIVANTGLVAFFGLVNYWNSDKRVFRNKSELTATDPVSPTLAAMVLR